MSLERWNKFRAVPEYAQKKITGGRLSGLTDIKPQWRYQVLTEEYGECGKGWQFEIAKLWTEPGSDGQVMCFASINLFVGDNAPIPGVGGSMLVTLEKNGLHTSDEGYKMAITDALSTACKMLGIGADVYMGGNHDSKYEKPPAKPTKKVWTTVIYNAMVEAISLGQADAVERKMNDYDIPLENFDNLTNLIKEWRSK